MGTALLTSILPLIVLSPFLIVGARRAESRTHVFLFALAFILNNLALFGGSTLHLGSWNWGGKACSILVSACFVFILRDLPLGELRLTPAQKPGSFGPAMIVLFSFLAVQFGVVLLSRERMAFGWETLAFQATMPGIDEELAFRGIYLALLDRVFTRRVKLLGADLGLGFLVVTLLFGLVHSLAIVDGGLQFHPLPLLWTAASGFVFGWLAESTGSLVMPVIAHNAGNVLLVVRDLIWL
jgi:membrane protease YdiL (CAAX protease family)